MRGVREVDPRLVEVAHAFCSTEYRLWTDLVLPSALPFVMTGIRLAIGRALIAVIVAEFYTAISGLGYLIVSNAHAFQTARVFVPDRWAHGSWRRHHRTVGNGGSAHLSLASSAIPRRSLMQQLRAVGVVHRAQPS